MTYFPLRLPPHVPKLDDGRKIIFLDVDGVFNYSGCKSRSRGGTHGIERDKVKLFKEILVRTKANFCVSSTWRKFEDDFQELEAALGPDIWSMCLGRTPTNIPLRDGEAPSEARRGREIQAWLDYVPSVTNIVIIDDDSDMAHLKPFLVKTSHSKGLLPERVEEAVRRLNEPVEHFLMTDQPPTCPSCGRRADIVAGCVTDDQLCKCNACGIKPWRLTAT